MKLRDGSEAESPTPTPWGVRCREEQCSLIYLTEACYDAQMSDPWSLWSCPRCGQPAVWDDANYETALEAWVGTPDND